MRKFYIIISIAILCFGAVLMSGCAQTGTVPATPTATATSTTSIATQIVTTAAPTVQVPVTSAPVTIGNVYNESSNGTTVSVPTNGTFVVMLQENPTTGYIWNVTVTNGLTIVNNTFMPPTSGLMGAGGVHTWSVQAIQNGAQQFNGIYKRPFENLTGNETTYILTVNVT